MVEDAEFVVVAKALRTPVIVELTLRPVGQPIPYLPGQYVQLGDTGYSVPARSYSIANAPRPSGEITVLVTRISGGETSTWLHDGVGVGATTLVSGPYGTFTSAGSTRPVLALAGGSGLAPIRALAEEAVTRSTSASFTVLLSARTEADVFDADLFAELNLQHPGVEFVRTLTRENGVPPIGHVQDVLPTLFSDLAGHDVYIAGAPGFVTASTKAARALGAPHGQIRTEEFFTDPQPWSVRVPTRALP